MYLRPDTQSHSIRGIPWNHVVVGVACGVHGLDDLVEVVAAGPFLLRLAGAWHLQLADKLVEGPEKKNRGNLS